MCGICGFQIYEDNNYSLDELKKITNTIKHRGPDEESHWQCRKENVYLGHQRLSIIDLSSSGSQPMISWNKRFVIAFNGEIYNYKKLAKENKLFINKNISSDTRLLLEIISLYGIKKAIQMVDGMFAFCIWDRKRNLFHLVRDRFGEKPLFYFLDSKKFIFGSEIKVIKKFVKNDNLKVNKKAFNYFFSLGYIPQNITIYENIYKVSPSEILTIKNGAIIDKISYWNNYRPSTKTLMSVGEVKNSIENSIEDMMVADVEVGCFLSGGIDSSLVASVMQKKSNKKIKTFSIGFNEYEYDESKYAKNIASYLNTDHYEIKLSIDDLLNNLDIISKVYDEPFGDSSCLPTLAVSEFASKYVKVCLSGDGGDEMFLGYNRYKVAKNFENLIFSQSKSKKLFLKLIKKVPLGVYDYISYPISKVFGLQGLSHKMQKIINILESKNNTDFYSRLNVMDNNLMSFLNNEFSNEMTEINKIELIDAIQFLDFKYYLPNDILVKVDRASMNHSLEVRSPFLNHKLYENLSNIPSSLKIEKGVSKSILKNILLDYIPLKLFDRPKMGFAIPLNRWIKSKKLKFKIEEVLNETNWDKCGVEKINVIETWKRFKKDKFCPPSVIWNYFIAGLWVKENL